MCLLIHILWIEALLAARFSPLEEALPPHQKCSSKWHFMSQSTCQKQSQNLKFMSFDFPRDFQLFLVTGFDFLIQIKGLSKNTDSSELVTNSNKRRHWGLNVLVFFQFHVVLELKYAVPFIIIIFWITSWVTKENVDTE